MAKKLFGNKLFATALATFALASCQSESTLLEPEANNLHEIELTVLASKGDDTRTNLDLSDDLKNIMLTWNIGDIIHVSETDGTYAGYLTVTELQKDGTEALFKGNVRTFTTSGKHTFTFISLGQGVEYSAGRGQAMDDKVYDFTNQAVVGADELERAKALAKNDLLIATGDVNISGGKATFYDLYMKRQFAFGSFKLVYNGTPLEFDANTVVTINTEENDIKTGATLSFPSQIKPAGESSISLTTDVNDLFVTLVPGSAESRIKFNVTVNGESYEGYSKNPFEIKKNNFFRKAAGLDKGEAIPIEMKHTDGRDDEKVFRIIYYQNLDVTYNSDGTVKNTNPTTYKQDKCYTTETEHTFTIKGHNDLFSAKDESLYLFQSWTGKSNGAGTIYNPGDKVTISTENTTFKEMEDNGKKYKVYTLIIYGYWFFNYTIEYQLGDGVLYSYTDPNTGQTVTNNTMDPRVANGNGKQKALDILRSQMKETVTKDGYKLIGWREVGTANNPVTDNQWHFNHTKVKVTLEPIWEKLPYTVETGGYTGDTI